MKNKHFNSDENLQEFYNRISKKIRAGFTLTEKNDKLPFAVLHKEPRNINHNYNFILCCLTFGLWSIVWMYLTYINSKEKRILIAIDEDGNTFEERCYS